MLNLSSFNILKKCLFDNSKDVPRYGELVLVLNNYFR